MAYGSGYAGGYAGTAFATTFSTPTIEVGFTNNALDEPVTWVDITKWVTQGRISRGRAHELSRFDAGTMALAVDNRDGRFSPFNTGSPYSPNVTPFRPIRARATYDGVTYDLYRGFIEAWQPKWSDATNSDMSVRCVDATKLLNMKKVSSADVYGHEVIVAAPDAYYRLDDPVGSTTAADSSGNGYTLTKRDTADEFPFLAPTYIPAWFFQAPGALTADTNAGFDAGHTEVELTGVVTPLDSTTTSVTIECWVKARGGTTTIIDFSQSYQTYLRLGADASGNATLDLAVHLGGSFTVTTAQKILDDQWHYLAATTDFTDATVYVDGVLAGTATIGGGTASGSFSHLKIGGFFTFGDDALTFDGVIDEVALYRTAYGAGTITSHYINGNAPRQGYQTGDNINFILDKLGWPAALESLDSGETSVHGFTNTLLTQSGLDNARLLADSEGGQLFIDAAGIITFFDRYHTSRAPYTTVQIVLGDGTSEEPYLLNTVDPPFDDTDIWNEVVITPLDLAAQVADDPTSQQLYGFRTLSRASVTDDADEALNQANFLLNQFKDPVQRVKSVSFTPMSDPSVLFPAALGLELLSRVEFIRRPNDGSSTVFDQEALIEGIDHAFTNGSWQTTWRLSPTDAASNVLIWDESNWDEAVWGY